MSNVPMPKVTVITPAYNAENLIGSTIKSVIDQSYTNWEMIIVDDCSTDNTRSVVQQWSEKESRIRLHTLEANFGGPAGPRNEGVRLAQGEFVAFLDSDDIWHPRKLEIQIRILEEESSSFVCSQMRDFTSENQIAHVVEDEVDFESVSFRQQSLRARIPTSSVIVSKALISSYPFNEDISYKAVEDYHCWLRLLQNTPSCLKVMMPLLHYRKIEGQISGSKLYMMRKVYMVHREYPYRSSLGALFLTFSHVLGGFYSRFLKKEM